MSELNTQQKASSTDLVAKLLATENITVMRRSVSTACFDLQQRILTLPTWKEMNDQEELMLVLHECSHALFTTYEKFKTVFTDQAELRDYANVLEDMRAESKMKLRYPGSRKMFFDGYRSLNERDFFGVKMHSLEALPLIDRLNLYYKVGGNCGVKFSKDEMVFLNRAERLNTEDEVIALARDIYEFAKAKRSNEMAADFANEDDEDSLANQPGGSGDDGEEEDEDSDVEFNESNESGESDDDEEDGEGDAEGEEEEEDEESGYGGGAGRGDEDNDPLESVTQRAFNSKLDDLADNSVEIRYFEPVIGASNCVFNPIVPYKAVLAEFTSNTQHNGINAVIALPSNKAAFNQWKSNNASMVNYLVKEFEMKKAATAYKRTSIAKTGQLDCKKLFAYKLKEDLFKQISQVKDGKKHGMLMLLDWSGSMNEHMAETVNQVMALASFCQRIQIPYEVYAFSDGYACDAENSAIRKAAFDLPTEDQITNPLGFRIPYFNLVQLFSNRMTGSEFNKMSEYLFNKPWYNASSRRASFGLNGTPLNEALLYMAEYAGQFKRNNSVEKLSFVTLTDGSGAGLYPAAVNKGTRISNGYTYDYESNTRKRIISTLRDPITKKQYSIDETAHSQTAALLKVIKDRYEANMVGFFITANSKNVIYRFLCTVTSVKNNSYSVGSLISSLRVKISSELSKNKCSVLSNAGGYDELYILNANIKIADGEIGKINDKMTSTQISRLLTKSLNTSKTSRIVLDRFITKIA